MFGGMAKRVRLKIGRISAEILGGFQDALGLIYMYIQSIRERCTRVIQAHSFLPHTTTHIGDINACGTLHIRIHIYGIRYTQDPSQGFSL